MAVGGKLVGRLAVEAARQHNAEGILLLQGPDTKVSNRTRSAWAAREVLVSQIEAPCILQKTTKLEGDLLLETLEKGVTKIDKIASHRVAD